MTKRKSTFERKLDQLTDEAIAEAVAVPLALEAITAKVLAHRPVDKGLAAKKTARKLKRKAKADD